MVDSIPDQSRKPTRKARPTSDEQDYLVLVDRSMDAHLVVYHDPKSTVAEQYRTFRTNLVALNPDSAPRALAVTSSIKGEGKSVSAANLALALAELPETRTLIIDADLRDPSIAELFGINQEPGLADLLLDGLPLDRVITHTLVPNLFVLPAGRPVKNSSELLGSPRIGDLVNVLKAEYNYLLFDTPPVIPFADATVLGNRVDGTLVVLRLDKTPKEHVERSLATLRAARNNLVGCFLAGSRSLQGDASEYVLEE